MQYILLQQIVRNISVRPIRQIHILIIEYESGKSLFGPSPIRLPVKN